MKKTGKTIMEVVERLKKENVTLHIGRGSERDYCSEKFIMLVTHDFSRSGAPTMLLEMAKMMKKKGFSVWVLCTYEGPLMERFLEEGINVIIYGSYLLDQKWMRVARKSFDLWCVNTMVLFDVFQYLNKMSANVIWWIHEGEGWFRKFKHRLPDIEVGVNSKILAAGPYVQQMFKQYVNMDVDVLNFMISDEGVCTKERREGQKVRFLQAGMIDGNKRQGLFAEAIELLPDEVRGAAEFIICGNKEGANVSELSKIERVMRMCPNVKLIPQVDRTKLFEMYDDVDAVVVASLIETTSAVMVEAMMKGKVGICSSTCGVASYLEDGKNGYIFESGNAKDLADRISYVVSNIKEMKTVGAEARKVYENVYSEEVFTKQIDDIMSWSAGKQALLENVALTSIIIVASNNKEQLLLTLRSIYSQTYQKFEVIIIDDASEDGTVDAVEAEFGSKNNLKYFINESRLGRGECYNLGLECCEGEYVVFAEAGDVWINDKLENQLELLVVNEEYDGVYSYVQLIERSGKKVLCPSAGMMISNIQHMLLKEPKKVQIGSIVLRKRTFERINAFCVDLDYYASYEFLLREMGNVRLLGMSEITMIAAEYTNEKDTIEEFIYTNCLVLINQFDDIQASGYREEFFSDILMKMDRLGVKASFLEILHDNAPDLLEIYGTQKRINANMKACSGCGACASSCPVSAIEMKQNDKGFWCPVIDAEKCINCNKCVKVCPVNSEKPVQDIQQEIYAIKRLDDNRRMESQSGGAFAVLAEKILDDNGLVYGAGFSDDLEVVYQRVDSKNELIKLKGSKYVQAKVGNVFAQVRQDLLSGRKVLFCGTACHVDGLKRYVGDLGQNLYTCDLVCHGVPSPMLYKDYLRYIEDKHGKVVSFNFRDKAFAGWRGTVESWKLSEGDKFSSREYAQLFYSCLAFRESCYSCKYASMHRISDITIGDFWGIENVYPDMDDGKGVSLMLINSEKGKFLFEKIESSIEFRSANASQCRQHNLVAPSNRPQDCDEFWKHYLSKDFRYILRTYVNEHHGIAANQILLSNWEKWMEAGNRISTWLYDNQITKIALCGDKDNNRLIMADLKSGKVQVTAEMDVYSNAVTRFDEESENVMLLEFVQKEMNDLGAVIVTDEVHAVDIIDMLHKAGVPVLKILPLSFIVTQEV